MLKLYHKLMGWLLYRAFLFISRRVTFADFTRVWNHAYADFVEAEWTKLKRESMNIKYMQGGLEVCPEAMLKELPSGLTLLRREPKGGQGESYPMQPPTQIKGR